MAVSPGRVVCPKCSWDGARTGKRSRGFVLFQFLVREHEVLGEGRSGTLKVRREAHREDTGGARPLLRCGKCGHEFDLPPGRKVKFE